MQDVYNDYRILRKNVFRSYWERRILSEIGYLLELLEPMEPAERELLEQAVALLGADYRENKQIQSQTAQTAEQLLLPLSAKAKSITLICAAHAHIDMNWMWGYQETVALTLDTVRTMLTLMKEYPDFAFSQSQASVYRILEEYAPELLEEVRQRVREGRWEVTASTWVENDKNMPSGESMARHLLYTKEYLSQLLGIDERTLNLDFEPDTFGHSANLPEILTGGGVTRYYHCRGYDGESIYRWKGVSGAEVLAYREPRWYNGVIDNVNDELYIGVPEYCRKYGIDHFLLVCGAGDHGGGPTRRDLDRLHDMDAWPLSPAIRFGTFREFFDYLEEHKEQFPVVEQEMNYVFTGCYTSQSRIKMANRMGEVRLAEAEILGSMAKLESGECRSTGVLKSAWEKILFNQFHDIIPGSGTVDTREYALGQFQEAMAHAGAYGVYAMDVLCNRLADGTEVRRTEDTAMGAGVGKGASQMENYGFPVSERGGGSTRYLALFNVTQEVRTEPVEITLWDWQESEENTRISDMEGREYPFVFLEQGVGYWWHNYCKLLVYMPVPALGYRICRVEEKAGAHHAKMQYVGPKVDHITDEPICLENDKVKALFESATMKCISFVHKTDGREFLSPHKPALGLVLLREDTSEGMTAWREGRTVETVDLNDTCFIRFKAIQTQGMQKKLEYEIRGDHLKVDAAIVLNEGSETLDCSLKTVWTMLGEREKGVPQLRFQVPCGYEVEKYRYRIPYGILERQPLAQDVPSIGLGCAVPAAGGSALYMISNCKYGFRGDRDGMSLNLIRASCDPDPYPEIGEHNVRIAVGICEPEAYDLTMIAERFLHPVIVRSCAAKPEKDQACKSLFAVEGAVLSAIKEAENGNGFILRVFNPSEETGTVKIALPGRKLEAYQCDLLEHDLEPISSEAGILEYTLGGYEVGSFRLISR